MPGSDVDIVLLVSSEEDPRELLDKLAKKLIQTRTVSQLEKIYTTKVPILKIKDKLTGILLDISCNIENGVEAVEIVKDYLARYP